MNIYDFAIEDNKGREVSLSDFRGQVLIVVNSAVTCGFTPQYEELEAMYEKYHDRGLMIIDIPCNQFARQAEGTDEEIGEFCRTRYGTRFPQMKKSEVRGDNGLPLYRYLTGAQPFKGFGQGAKALMMTALMKTMGLDAKDDGVRWNFTKFVVDREGKPVARFECTHSMKDLERAVVTELDRQIKE